VSFEQVFGSLKVTEKDTIGYRDKGCMLLLALCVSQLYLYLAKSLLLCESAFILF